MVIVEFCFLVMKDGPRPCLSLGTSIMGLVRLIRLLLYICIYNGQPRIPVSRTYLLITVVGNREEATMARSLRGQDRETEKEQMVSRKSIRMPKSAPCAQMLRLFYKRWKTKKKRTIIKSPFLLSVFFLSFPISLGFTSHCSILPFRILLSFALVMNCVSFHVPTEWERGRRGYLTFRRMTTPSSTLVKLRYFSSSSSALSPCASSTGVLCVCHPVIVFGRPA